MVMLRIWTQNTPVRDLVVSVVITLERDATIHRSRDCQANEAFHYGGHHARPMQTVKASCSWWNPVPWTEKPGLANRPPLVTYHAGETEHGVQRIYGAHTEHTCSHVQRRDQGIFFGPRSIYACMRFPK